MPSVLIAGCGYLGRATADLLHNAGWMVEGWTSSSESAKRLSQAKYPVRAINILNANEICACDREFGIVIHSASTRGGDVDLYHQIYFDGVRNLLKRFGHSIMIFVGSTSVYAQTNGQWVTEQSVAEPRHPRGKILRKAEQLVLEGGGIAARLAGIYGPGRSYLLQRFLNEEAVVDPTRDRFVNQIHRDDAATALFMFANRTSEIAGEIFNVVDNQPILQSECYRWLAKKLNRPVPPTGESAFPGKRGRSDKRISNAKLRGLGWMPCYPTFAEAMEKSILPSFGRGASPEPPVGDWGQSPLPTRN